MLAEPMTVNDANRNAEAMGTPPFRLTDKHLSRDDMRRLKTQCDETSSAALERLQEIHKESTSKPPDGSNNSRFDTYALLKKHHLTDPVLTRFWDSMYTTPDWVDWAQLERGQRVFHRYGSAMLIGFMLQGFMGDNAATPGIAEVLVLTGGFSTRMVLRRALETFQWLLQVTSSLEAIQPGGEGHTSTARIRLLHASVRQRILKLQDSKPDYFDVEKYGLPINKLDDIHSIALFACNPVWLQLPVMGIRPKAEEIDDYVALFRYLGHLLAVPQHYFATTTEAKMVMEAMCVYERRPTETSKILCHNFVNALEDKPPFRISAGFVEAGARLVNGDELTDAEGLARPGWMSYAKFRGFCWLACSLVFLQRLFPSFDDYMIKTQRRWFYSYMIENGNSLFSLGGPSKFEMKYDPQIGKTTRREIVPESASDSAFWFRPLESLFLAVFVLGCGFGLAMTYVVYVLAHTLVSNYGLLEAFWTASVT